ncbi:MAG: hypothetical protein K2W86_14890 [Sphingomonas sp.]|uniref:LexA family protein n=1 Tax=Sphingomonas sp. TaxID=28214 RepID=UPI0035A96036|nr:hypothetical protein [Sphingomonas sp.]
MSPADQRAALLRYIWGYQVAHEGVSPSITECAKAIGACRSQVHRLLIDLENDGSIRRLRGRERAIRVVRQPTLPHHAGRPLFSVPFRGRYGRFVMAEAR